MPRPEPMSDEEIAARGAAARAALETYCHDLTALARQGRFAPLAGREAEVARVFAVLARQHPLLNKKCAVLLAEPGPERFAIVQEVARRIAHEDVPDRVRARRMMALDIGALVSDTTRRGEFEGRLKLLLEGVRLTDGRTILFVEDLHSLVGAGAAEGCVDAVNVLTPALARNEVQLVGTTSLEDYCRYIERDAGLQRRFQEVVVREPAGA